MHFNDVDGSTSFIDEKGHTFSSSGATISNEQSKFGGTSLKLSNIGFSEVYTPVSYADITSTSSTPFTVEC